MLYDAIDQTKAEVTDQLPALGYVLDQVREMVKPLLTDGARLSSAEGQRSLLALARLYQKMGRYSEAISILREGWITLGAPPSCDSPGTNEFDNQERKNWDGKWARRNGDNPDPVAELRNDIQHAGFNKQPHARVWFEEQLTGLLEQWEIAIDLPLDGNSRHVDTVPERAMNKPVFYRIGVDHPITPDEPLPPLPEIPRGALVVVEGRAPIWRYGLAFHRLHGSPAGAIAVYDPRLGAVVVATHHPEWRDGQIIDVAPPYDEVN